MFRYLPIAAASFIFATAAQAQDFPNARVEANVGWDHVRGNLKYKDTAFPEDNFSESENTDGVVFGVTAGYDIPIGHRFYLGVEASADFADNKRCMVVFGDDSACFKVKRNFAIGGRLGTAFTKRAMFYVGAAYVNGKATVRYTDYLDPSYDISVSDERDGYRISAGTEVRIKGNFYTKLEYRYSDYDNYQGSLGTESAAVGFDRHQIVGGVGVRF